MRRKHIVAGGISGLVEVSCTHPLDYMKIVLQQRKSIKMNELYRGIVSRYGSIFPMRAILWSSKDIGVKQLKQWSILQQGTVIGSGAGFMQTFIDVPCENIKVQKIYSNKVCLNPYNLSKGFLPNMARNIILCCGIVTGSLTNSNSGVIFGSLVGCILSQPFDYIKTIQQTGIQGNYTDIMKGWQYRAVITPLNMVIGYNIYDFLVNNV